MTPPTSCTVTPVAVSTPVFRSRNPALPVRMISQAMVGTMSRIASISVSCSAARADLFEASADSLAEMAASSLARADRSDASADRVASLVDRRWYLNPAAEITSALNEKTTETPMATQPGASPQSIVTTRTVTKTVARATPTTS